MPLSVFIADSPNLPGFQPALKEAVKSSFTEWEQATGGRVKFTFTSDPERAALGVTWSADPAQFPTGREADRQIYTSHDKTLAGVRLTLPTRTQGPPMTAARMKAISLHAIGHSLGILGHSGDPQDVMSWNSTAQKLSERDRTTFKRYYSSDPLVAKAPAFKGNTAGLDKASRLFNEGTVAAKAEDYAMAINKFEQSYKLERRRELVLNLCACYNAAAAERYKAEKFMQAEKYIRKSIAMCERGRDRELLAQVFNNFVTILQRTGRNQQAAHFMLDHAGVLSLVMESPAKAGQAILLDEEAHQLMMNGKFDQAEQKFREAIAFEPETAALHAHLAKCLYDQGRFEDAIECSKKAIEYGSTAEWLRLAGAFERLGRSQESLDAYQKLIAAKPDLPGANVVKNAITDLQNDIKEQATKGAAEPDYVDHALEHGVNTWKYLSAPISVYIKDGAEVPNYLPAFTEILKAAFEEWHTASDSKIQFAFVDNPESARIMVEWTDDPSVLVKKDRRGLTKLIPARDNQIAQARIYLLTQDLTEPLAKRDMRTVCLHEIGHAIGLGGHSPNPQDILHESSYVQALSSRDKGTITRLYADNDELVTKLAAKPQSAEPQVTGSTADNQVYQLNTDAVAASRAGNFTEAVRKYEEALAIDPYHPIIMSNLCFCLNGLAAEKAKAGNSEEAESLLRRALTLCEKGGQEERVTLTLENLTLLLEATGKLEDLAKLKQRGQPSLAGAAAEAAPAAGSGSGAGTGNQPSSP